MTKRVMSNRAARFPATIAAAFAADGLERRLTGALFAVGDALVLECGSPGVRGAHNGSGDRLRACAAELKRVGLPGYTLDHLRDLRSVAANFPHGERSPSASWSVHEKAGDAATLKAAIRAARSESVPLTVSFVERFKKLKQRQQERTDDAEAVQSVEDAVREFRTACADARDRADDALAFVDLVRADHGDALITEVESVQAAWQRVREAIRAPGGGSVRVFLAEAEEPARAASAIFRDNVKTVGFIPRGAILEKQRKNDLAVAVDETGAVVGAVSFHVRRDRVAVIYEIAVAKARARRGIGTALMGWIKAEAARRNAVAIQLKCTADNDAANAFYRKLGFENCGEVPGKKRPLFVWRRALGEPQIFSAAAE